MNLDDARVIVTGASAGLGLETARLLLERGALVAGWARGEARLREIADALGDRFTPVVCDVRDDAAVREALETTRRELGHVDVLVNNAGVGRFGAIDELSKEDWDEMIDTNVTGVFHVTRAVVPLMKERGSGHIVNVASIAGKIGNPELSGYNASKFAVRGLSDALFKELRDSGIKVTAIFPGSIDTDFSATRSGRSTRRMAPREVAEVITHVLERSDNFLISEVVMRPLRPR